jgi:hypothetical protein
MYERHKKGDDLVVVKQLHYIASISRIIDELEGIWKEAGMA